MAGGKTLQAVVEIAGSLSPTLGTAAQQAQNSLEGINLKAIATGVALGGMAAAGVSAGISIASTLADMGNEYNKTMNALSAKTGETGKELEKLGAVAQDVYANNFGESMEAAAEAVAQVNTLTDLSGEALQGATESACLLADTFEYEISESTRAASALMKNMGIDATEAYNIIAYGAQNGADQNGDLIDTLNEYAAQYSALGLSADQFVVGLTNASDAGVFSIDKVGDAVKEFNIRSKDLSDSSAQAYKSLGLNAKEMFKKFGEGGASANEAFFEVVNALQEMENPLKKNEAAVALFGTMYEDLGEDILPILSSMENATLDGVDALGQINEVKYNDLDSALEGMRRKMETAFSPLAASVNDALMDIMPSIFNIIDGVIPVIEGATAEIVPMIGDMTASIIPIIEGIMPVILESAQMIASNLIPTIMQITQQLLPILINLVSRIVPLVSQIITAILPAMLKLITAILPPIMQITQQVLPIVIDLISSVIPLLVQIITTILPVLMKIITTMLPHIMQIAQQVLPVIINLISSIMPLLSQIIMSIMPSLLTCIKTFLPMITQIVQQILPVVSELLSGILPLLKNVVTSIMPSLLKVITSILPPIMKIIYAVLPLIINLLNMVLPILTTLIDLLLPIVDTVFSLIEPIINLATTAITPLISILSSLISLVLQLLAPALQFVAGIFTGYLGAAIQGISPIIESVKQILQGLIDFIINVFSGNWGAAWQGIVGIFEGIVSTITGIFKLPINAVIGGINKFLEGLNGITIPDWVPGVGGMGFNIPTIPMLAKGGFTEGISIAGEAGTEAVISFDRSVRAANIGYWEQAGEMLGVYDKSATALAGSLLDVDDFSLTELAQPSTTVIYDFSGFTWSPVVAGGTAAEDNDDLMRRLKAHEAEFFDWLERWLESREVTAFA